MSKNIAQNKIDVPRFVARVSSLILGVILFSISYSAVDAQDLQPLAKQISVKVESAEKKDCKQVDQNGDELSIECFIVQFTDKEDNQKQEITIYANSASIDGKYDINEGDKIYVIKSKVGEDYAYTFTNFDRSSQYIFIGLLFAGLTIVIGGRLGFRSIISLILSGIVLVALVIPLIVQGYNPVLVATIGGSLILFASIYLSHGISRQSSVAVIGTISGIIFALVISLIFTQITKLTGLSNEYSFMLNLFQEGAEIDMRGVLLASFILGGVGVVDDAAVSQVAVVAELLRTGKKFKFNELFFSALRVGQSHIGSLVNTLFMAYISSALPLMIIFVIRNENFQTVLNLDMFAEEVVRTAAGSMGLIFSVPATTFFAAKFLKYKDVVKGKQLHTHNHDHSGGHSHSH